MDIRNSPLETAVLEVLRLRLADARLSQREVERLLGLNHGVIGSLLRGRTALRVQHLELLGRLLGITPDQILVEALGISESPGDDDRFARRVASHVVDELLQRATSIGALASTSPHS